ncbi:MAG: hypothetical protein ACFFAN_11505 [Promethearchaeota archaeon]
MKIKGEDTFFGELINSPEEFIEDLCDRMNKMYAIVMDEESKTHQLKYIIGFLRAFKGRLNRICKTPNNTCDFTLISQNYN